MAHHLHLRVVNNLPVSVDLEIERGTPVVNLSPGEVAMARVEASPQCLVTVRDHYAIELAFPLDCQHLVLVVNSASITVVPDRTLKGQAPGEAYLKFVNASSQCGVSLALRQDSRVLQVPSGAYHAHRLLGKVEVYPVQGPEVVGEAQPHFLYSGQSLVVVLLDTSRLVFLERRGEAWPEVVGKWSPERYMGNWYQVGAIPQFFSLRCAFSRATYTLVEHPEGPRVKVYNRCLSPAGEEVDRVTGWGYPRGPGAFRVEFPGYGPPGGLEDGGQAIPNYLVHDTDYHSYSLVGSPDRTNLYVLSRRPTMRLDLYRKLLRMAQNLGYDVNQVKLDVELD